MNSINLLKTIIIFCAPILFISCSSWEEVAAPDEFKPLKIISISSDSAYVGQSIIIQGENFIDNKEYNQVWFGGNVRGTVDSATSTQLFLKVPKGIQTGFISVSNGIYSDTLQIPLKIVLRELAFKTMTMSFGGIQVNEKFKILGKNIEGERLVMKNGWYQNLSFSRYKASELGNYFQYKECGFPVEDEYSDSTLQLVKNDTVGSNRYKSYTFVNMSVDNVNNILPNLSFMKLNQSNIETSNSTGSSGCSRINFILKNVPYSIVNGKKYVKLNSTEMQKCFTSYFETSFEHAYSGIEYTLSYTDVLGILKILPDAYFELTLE